MFICFAFTIKNNCFFQVSEKRFKHQLKEKVRRRRGGGWGESSAGNTSPSSS
jgi:hypothetical protein